jgi:sugar (pentulose or hexulose) kinase
MSGTYIGVDVGTTRVKAVAVDERGQVCGEAERPTPWRHGADGGVDVDPVELADVAIAVAAEAGDGGPAAGVGVTGMAETGVLVDGRDRPLAPAIAWHDPRGDVDTIAGHLGGDLFRRTTGLPLTALPSLAKLLWLRRHHPDTARAVRFHSVGEWVVRRLGGAPVTELSLASRTGLLELATAREWSAATDLLGLRRLLTEPVVAGTPAGRAGGEHTPPALRGATLTVAGHDHQVAAYAVGAAVDGALFNSLGTAEALVRTVRPPLTPEQVADLTGARMSVGWGVVAGHLCVLAGLKTGLALGRLAVRLGATTTEDRIALAGDAVWRSAVDAHVADAGRLLAAIEAVAGPHREVVVGGGWLRDPALRAAKARQFPGMRASHLAEPGACGAALLAGARRSGFCGGEAGHSGTAGARRSGFCGGEAGHSGTPGVGQP